jgi:hypothetical protein
MFELVVIYKIKLRQVTGKKNSNETQLYSADIHAINDPIVCFGCLRTQSVVRQLSRNLQ